MPGLGVILLVGFVDDTRSLGPRVKLLGQALAVLILCLGGIRIHSIEVLNLNLDLGFPAVRFGFLGFPVDLALPSLLVTMFWFLGCMNIWNLIDGMDGIDAFGCGLVALMHPVQAQVAGLALRVGPPSLAHPNHCRPRLGVVQAPLAIAPALAQIVKMGHRDGRQPCVFRLAVPLVLALPECAALPAPSRSHAPRPGPAARCLPGCSAAGNAAADTR